MQAGASGAGNGVSPGKGLGEICALYKKKKTRDIGERTGEGLGEMGGPKGGPGGRRGNWRGWKRRVCTACQGTIPTPAPPKLPCVPFPGQEAREALLQSPL